MSESESESESEREQERVRVRVRAGVRSGGNRRGFLDMRSSSSSHQVHSQDADLSISHTLPSDWLLEATFFMQELHFKYYG